MDQNFLLANSLFTLFIFIFSFTIAVLSMRDKDFDFNPGKGTQCGGLKRSDGIIYLLYYLMVGSQNDNTDTNKQA